MLLVIDKKNSLIRHKSDVLWIYQDEKLCQKIPVRLLEQVIVYGNPLAETAVWRALAEAGVTTVFLSARGKRQSTFLGAGLAAQLGTRRQQHEAALVTEYKRRVASYVLLQKVKSYRYSLLILQQYCPSAGAEIEHFTATEREMEKKIPTAGDISELMGYEGSLAAAWFKLLANHLPSYMGFDGRNRRPPKDPINALLSLSYTLLAGEIHQQAVAYGWDPSLGFLHQPESGRESLILDVLEIFRATVDAFVIAWSHQYQAQWDDFFNYSQQQGCRLSKTARPEFFNAWANCCQSWPRPFDQVEGADDWASAPIREIIAGELISFRDQIKQTIIKKQ